MKRLALALLALVVIAAGVFSAFRVPDTDPQAMRLKYGPPPSHYLKLPDGLVVHYRDEGPRAAPVLVLLHGSNADLHTWQPWVDRLTDRYRVIRFDQRGHGLTGAAPDGDYGTEAFVADVAAVATALGLQRFAIAGNSMGGGIAARYALAHPARLDALILIDAAGAPVAQKGGGNLAFTLARIPGVSALGMAVMPRGLIEKSLRQSVSNQAVVTPQAIDRYWELARYPGNRAATLERFKSATKALKGTEVRHIAAPTLVMWGEDDALLSVAGAHWFGRAIPGAQVTIYPDTGHLPMEEVADRSARDVAAFLAALPRAEAGGTSARAARSSPKPAAP